MKRQAAISKNRLFISALAPLCLSLFVIWGIITVIFIVAVIATQNKLIEAFIGSSLFLSSFLVLILWCSLYMIPGLKCIKRQESWFSVSFDQELKGQFIQKDIFVNDTWYICVSGMRLFAFRKSYITKVVKTRLDKQHRTDIILTVNTIDGRVLKLYFQRGDEDRIKLLKEFIQH